jgi:hypothetical protein
MIASQLHVLFRALLPLECALRELLISMQDAQPAFELFQRQHADSERVAACLYADHGILGRLRARHNVTIKGVLGAAAMQEQLRLGALLGYREGRLSQGCTWNPSCFAARRMRSSRLSSSTLGTAERTANADAK